VRIPISMDQVVPKRNSLEVKVSNDLFVIWETPDVIQYAIAYIK
jgi:hypothetical protein